MRFLFNAFGHENILSLHRNTIEFTKDKSLSRNGDCIIGIDADFDLDKLIEFVKENKGKRINCKITVDELSDEFNFDLNEDFSDKHEIVVRKTEFLSERTLGINADKAAKDIDKRIVERIKNKNTRINVIFSS